MLRVLVASPGAMTYERILSLLRTQADFQLVSTAYGNEGISELLSQADADVLVVEIGGAVNGNALEQVFLDSLAIVALLEHPSAGLLKRLIGDGIKGALPEDVSGEELAEAVRTAAAGLVVLSPEFAAVLALDTSDQMTAELDPILEPLTPREQDVLSMMAEGLLNKEIADRLRISEHTVKFHVSSIMGKLDASSRTEAVMRGIRRGIVTV